LRVKATALLPTIEDHLGWHWNYEYPLALVRKDSRSKLFKSLIITHIGSISDPELLNQSECYYQFCMLLQDPTKQIPEKILSGIDLHHVYRDKKSHCLQRYATPLGAATVANHPQAVKQLLEHECDTEKHYSGMTPLQVACARGCKDIVALMITSGVPLNTQAMYTLRTALHFAAEEGHTEILHMLVRAGADCSIKDFQGYTAAEQIRSRIPIG
jgi:hypothetical protein